MNKQVENEVKNYKPKPPRITGITTINHSMRVEMGLGVIEYVLMDGIINLKKQNKPVTVQSVFIRTGLIEQEQGLALEYLVKKGYIFPEQAADGSPVLSDRWNSFFKSIEAEFDDFWTKDGKVCWQGSKTKAQSLYAAARKKYPREHIIKQRDEYFRYLDLLLKSQGFARAKMQATRFLGPQDDLNQDWTGYCKQEEAKIKKEQEIPEPAEDPSPSVKTKEERMRKYEDQGS